MNHFSASAGVPQKTHAVAGVFPPWWVFAKKSTPWPVFLLDRPHDLRLIFLLLNHADFHYGVSSIFYSQHKGVV